MENKIQPKGIMMMKSYYDAINDLDDTDQIIMFKAIMEFGFNGIEPNFDKKYLNGYWKLISPTLSKGIASYISKVENGKKGAAAKHGKIPEVNKAPLSIDSKDELLGVLEECKSNMSYAKSTKIQLDIESGKITSKKQLEEVI